MLHKQDAWWRNHLDYRGDGHLPDGLGCIAADGRRFSVDDVVTALRSGARRWNEFRSSLPSLRWYRTKDGRKFACGFVLRLAGQNLQELDFSGYHLSGCEFIKCNMSKSNFIGSRLNSTGPDGVYSGASRFRGSKLRKSKISGDVSSVDFSYCDLRGGELNGIWASHTKFDFSVFTHTLIAGTFEKTSFDETDFADSYMIGCKFIDVDLSCARNLSMIRSMHDIVLDHRTILRSGVLSRSFYQSCGFPEPFVDFFEKHLSDSRPQPVCFLSHSSIDSRFCQKLNGDLQSEGIRCFYSPKDLRFGAVFRDSLEQEIRRGDMIVVVLSRNSISSTWVENEIEAAFERERREGKTFLIPIMIDDSPMRSDKAWVATLRRQRNIADFRSWSAANYYQPVLRRLCDDIKASIDGRSSAASRHHPRIDQFHAT